VRILILGPQGSGKGTQAKKIAAAYDAPHVATGDILREAVSNGSELGKQVRPILERGDLVPDELMVELIRERLADEHGFVLDGFPRTVPQAEALDLMLSGIGKPLDAVLLLRVRDGVAVHRLEDRAAAEGRADDAPDPIANRLRLYHELTEPVIGRYVLAGTLREIDGEGTVDDVAAEIDDALGAVGAASQ
jgi:adenylate kinase